MIEIKVGNTYLDTFKDTSITFELINPLFSDEIGANSYSFSFNLPNTPNNRKALGFIDVLLIPYADLEVENAKLLFNTIPLFEGVLIINEVNSQNISTAFNVDAGAFASTHRDKMLSSYELGGVKNIGDHFAMKAHADEVITQNADLVDYMFFPIINYDFYGGNNLSTYRERVNHYSQVLGFRDNWDYILGIRDDEYVLTPFPFLVNILNYLFSELSYSLSGSSDWWENEEIKTLTMYNNAALDEWISSFNMTSGAGTRKVNKWKENIDLSEHMPPMTTGELMKGLGDLFGLVFFINEKGKSIQALTRDGIIKSTEYVDWRDKTIKEQPVYSDFIGGFTFGYETDSSDQIHADIKDVSNYNENEEVLSSDDLPIGNDTDTLNTIRYTRLSHSYYRYNLLENTSPATYEWVWVSHVLKGETIGDGSKKITATIPPTPMSFKEEPSLISGDFRLLPRFDQLGTSDIADVGQNPFRLRLLFYRGMQPHFTTNDTYPLGSSDVYNARGEIVGNYSMFYEGEYGLYENWWKQWAEARMQAKSFKQSFLLELPDISSISWWKRHKVKTEMGDTNAFIKKMSVTITNNGLKPAQAEMIRM